MQRSSAIATAALAACGAGATGVYLGLVTGAAPISLGVGRTTRPLGR